MLRTFDGREGELLANLWNMEIHIPAFYRPQSMRYLWTIVGTVRVT